MLSIQFCSLIFLLLILNILFLTFYGLHPLFDPGQLEVVSVGDDVTGDGSGQGEPDAEADFRIPNSDFGRLTKLGFRKLRPDPKELVFPDFESNFFLDGVEHAIKLFSPKKVFRFFGWNDVDVAVVVVVTSFFLSFSDEEQRS